MDEEIGARNELDKSRLKIKEMERTIIWWSDSTANWREKWGKVKAEKHRHKEESRLLKARNEALTKDLNRVNVMTQELSNQKEILKMELTRVNGELRKFHNGKQLAIVEPNVSSRITTKTNDDDDNKTSIENNTQLMESKLVGDDNSIFAHILSCADKLRLSNQLTNAEDSFGSDEAMLLRHTISECQRRLALKTTEYESALSENLRLTKQIEDSTNKTSLLEKGENTSHLNEELNVGRCSSRSNHVKEMKLKDIRHQVERLQQENSSEWSKREKLESENGRLDRETKRLNIRIEELELEVRQKTEMIANAQSVGMKCLQTELDEKMEQLSELKITCNRLKKQLQGRDEELQHEKKRTDQYSEEIKKLRQRVEDLKRQLMESEERADHHTNNVRRLQRSLEEQTQQTDNLQIQINYLTTRLKRQSVTSRTIKDLTADASSDETDD